MTPRELAAHRRVLESRREFEMSLHAGLQATLHNAHFRTKKEDPVYSPDMFMPGYRKPDTSATAVPQWKRERDAMMRKISIAKPPDEETIRKRKEGVVMIDDRMKRAREARERGEGKDVIERIMAGAA